GRATGAPDPQRERRDGRNQEDPVLPGHRVRRVLRRVGPGGSRHRRKPRRCNQQGREPGLYGGYLRASIVRSPFDRVNTGDNTPAVIHVDVVPGAELRILVMAKGGGCENRSKYRMLTPAEGVSGVKEWIIECVKTAGPDACPPLI